MEIRISSEAQIIEDKIMYCYAVGLGKPSEIMGKLLSLPD